MSIFNVPVTQESANAWSICNWIIIQVRQSWHMHQRDWNMEYADRWSGTPNIRFPVTCPSHRNVMYAVRSPCGLPSNADDSGIEEPRVKGVSWSPRHSWGSLNSPTGGSRVPSIMDCRVSYAEDNFFMKYRSFTCSFDRIDLAIESLLHARTSSMFMEPPRVNTLPLESSMTR